MIVDFSAFAPATEAALTACLGHINADGTLLEEITINYTDLTLTAAPALDTVLSYAIT